MVIGEGFMDKSRYSHVKFAHNAGDYDSEYNDLFYEINENPNFSEAIKLLMGEKEDEKTD
jgi:hypothetical protein